MKTLVSEETLRLAEETVKRTGAGFTFTYAEVLALIAEVREARRRSRR